MILMNKSNKIILLTGILFLLFSVAVLPLCVGSIIRFSDTSKTTYDELLYKEFTVEEVRKTGNAEDGYVFNILVVEEQKLLKINNLLTERNVIAGLSDLRKGDVISCYLIEDSSHYEVVEIKSDVMILSLEQYKQIYYNQGLLGIIMFPILFFVFAGIGTYSIVAYCKNAKL